VCGSLVGIIWEPTGASCFVIVDSAHLSMCPSTHQLDGGCDKKTSKKKPNPACTPPSALYPSVCLSVHPSVCRSVCPSACRPARPLHQHSIAWELTVLHWSIRLGVMTRLPYGCHSLSSRRSTCTRPAAATRHSRCSRARSVRPSWKPVPGFRRWTACHCCALTRLATRCRRPVCRR
jgi:hypothetical protein